KWVVRYGLWGEKGRREAPVEFEADTPKMSPNEPDLSRFLAILASLVAVTVAKRSSSPSQGKKHVSRQSPNSRRRKRTAESPGGIQTRHRREVRHAILHHESGREGCTTISLRGVGADRAETGGTLHLQPHEEEVSRPGELLGTDGRDRRPGPSF